MGLTFPGVVAETVVEGQDFVGGKHDRRYYVKLGLENAQWRTCPSLKSNDPSWREYFIGYPHSTCPGKVGACSQSSSAHVCRYFVGTKLESPSIGTGVAD